MLIAGLSSLPQSILSFSQIFFRGLSCERHYARDIGASKSKRENTTHMTSILKHCTV